MTILCIETSTSVCSAAVCKDGALIKQCISYEGSNHARLLPSYIEELLSFTREQHLSLDAVALSEGPGSYTGLRIGTSTAKGLCYGLSVPLIAVPTLEVLCEAARQHSAFSNQHSDILIPMIDARRKEVYTAIFDSESKVESPKSKEERARAVVVESEESLIKGLRDKVQSTKETEYYYFGDGAAKCQAVLTSPRWHYIPDIVPQAQYVGVLAERRESEEDSPKMISGAELAYYEPFYLKEFVAAKSHVKGLN
ncbi:MAG: tRNA (adenosine(37)-N6)-threonylcarbamoyltransferase complex dimerization subunit type 1 TsaB [Paludibacteraceae bacterium]|nr:tRNA (adenosine(37)-N6)-threonylcarbamoyltransferase complex dimerization subunit type 1 TsaB [Paludibacteraceae bacterium]